MRILLSLLVPLLMATPVLADALLIADESSLSFVSIKNVDVAEAHRFARLEGWLGDDGRFRVAVHLDSVDTQIPIRDERLREVLFQTTEHPLAVVSGQVDPAVLADLADGRSLTLEVPFTLDLHGVNIDLQGQVRLSRAGGVLQVVSVSPVLLQAAAVGLDAGIETLREIAGLQSIGKAVPVYFLLRFTSP